MYFFIYILQPRLQGVKHLPLYGWHGVQRFGYLRRSVYSKYHNIETLTPSLKPFPLMQSPAREPRVEHKHLRTQDEHSYSPGLRQSSRNTHAKSNAERMVDLVTVIRGEGSCGALGRSWQEIRIASGGERTEVLTFCHSFAPSCIPGRFLHCFSPCSFLGSRAINGVWSVWECPPDARLWHLSAGGLWKLPPGSLTTKWASPRQVGRPMCGHTQGLSVTHGERQFLLP